MPSMSASISLAGLCLLSRGRGKVVVVSPKLLSTYVNDHLAGSAAGIDLVEKMRSSYAGTDLGDLLEELEDEIKADRAALEQVMEALSIAHDPVKQAGGWMIEKLSRIKFDVTGSDELSRLMETETLSLGIEGKLCGWRALQQVSHGEIDGVDFGELIKRAEDQRRRLEPFRIDAARRALVDSELDRSGG